MATGVSKTKWQGPLPAIFNGNGIGISLQYEGKVKEDEILQHPPTIPQLVWQSGTNTNRFYVGDNLPLLASLINNPDVYQQVKLIYIDPPFATNSVFRSRGDQDAYSDLLVGGPFLEFLRKRLLFLRELLADDGSIYVHLDATMAFHVKIIMDEIFGEKNFRNWITRRKCSHKNYTKRQYGNISDYILYYTKTDAYIWNRPIEAWTNERALKEYTSVEENTGRRYKKVPIHAPGIRNGATGQPWRGMMPPQGKHWQYPPATLEEMDQRGEIYWSSTGNPRRKLYLDQSDGIAIQDIWYDLRDDQNQNVVTTGYPTEKNPKVLERIIQASSNPNDLVLDCFSGSGTTLAVASQLGRRWIGIDSGLEALAATLKRFGGGTEKIGDYVVKTSEPITETPTQLDLFELSSVPLPANSPRVDNFAIFTESERYTAEIQGLVHKHFISTTSVSPA